MILNNDHLFLNARRSMTFRSAGRCIGAILLPALGLAFMLANQGQSGQSEIGADSKEGREVLDRAIAFLKSSQGNDGSFSPKLAGPGITAVVVAGLAKNGVSPKEPVLAKALEYLEKQVKNDGGIYDKFLANYTTS